jgi:hypothetical protein
MTAATRCGSATSNSTVTPWRNSGKKPVRTDENALLALCEFCNPGTHPGKIKISQERFEAGVASVFGFDQETEGLR